jgi:DNA-binding IclR family transcriptional regulator
LRAALELGDADEGSIGELAELSPSDTADILEALAADGFVAREGERWRVAE